jgi:uncharacterized delta-60 repeat protein
MVTISRYRVSIVSLALICTLFAVLVAARPASARPGDLDPTFAGTGTTTLDLGPLRGFVRASALQPDGKLIVTGVEQSFPTPSCVVARFNADGSRDMAFGNGGGLFTLVSVDSCFMESIVLRPDGRIVLGGGVGSSSASDRYSALIGLTPDGKSDPTFGGGDGYYEGNFLAGDENFEDLSLLPSGRILAITVNDTADPSVVTAFTTAGAVDTAFATSGQSGVGTGYMSEVHALADGRFVVAGKFGGSPETFRISRLVGTASAFDTTFGVNGHSTTTFDGGDMGLDAMVAQPDGKYLLAGSGYVGGKYKGILMRYTAEGQPDASFGVGGVVFASFQNQDYFHDVAVAPDGKIVAVGESSPSSSTSDLASLVVRFNADGSIDSGFGTGGAKFNVFGPGVAIAGGVVKIGADAKILVAATNQDATNFHRMSVTRLIGADPIPTTPLSAKISSPSKSKYTAKKFKKFAGTAAGDGLAKVQISVLKTDSKLLKKKKRCLQLSSNKAKLKKYKAVKKKCAPVKWLTATGTTSWSYKLKKALTPGKYTLYVRSLNAAGVAQSAPTKKKFTLTKSK